MKSNTKFSRSIFFLQQVPEFAQTEAEQKIWMDYMTVSLIHESMANVMRNGMKKSLSGWMKILMKMSTCTNKMVLGGRYQQSVTNGSIDGINIWA